MRKNLGALRHSALFSGYNKDFERAQIEVVWNFIHSVFPIMLFRPALLAQLIITLWHGKSYFSAHTINFRNITGATVINGKKKKWS